MVSKISLKYLLGILTNMPSEKIIHLHKHPFISENKQQKKPCDAHNDSDVVTTSSFGTNHNSVDTHNDSDVTTLSYGNQL